MSLGGTGTTTDLIKLHCDSHPDRLIDRFCLTREHFICGKCPISDNARHVDKRALEDCVGRIKELLGERMLEIVQKNSQPTQQLKVILTLQDQLIRMVAAIENGG